MVTHQVLRKMRRLRLWAFPVALKRYAWRLTGFCCWARILGEAAGAKSKIYAIDNRLFGLTIDALKQAGFVPVSQSLFLALAKLLAFFILTSFSWIQMIGFGVYILCWPLVLFFFATKYGQSFNKSRKGVYDKIHRYRKAQKRPVIAYILFSLLTAWFALFGDSPLRSPLIVGILLTGALFASRLYSAFMMTIPEPETRGGFLDRLIDTVTSQLNKVVEEIRNKLASGEILNFNRFKGNVFVSRVAYKILKVASIFLYGRAARRRVALYVLVLYIVNLATLGFLSILFWSLVIRYSLSPAFVEMRDAFLASASHVIPGMPDSTKIRVEAWIQASVSVTAWMIFVLYAGPVSSIYPVLQDSFLKKTARLYIRMRRARKTLKSFFTPMQTILGVLNEHPELDGVIKVVAALKFHPDLGRLFCEQPGLASALNSSPDIRKFVEGCGIVLPDLGPPLPNSPSAKEIPPSA